jgi:hypothetical protein
MDARGSYLARKRLAHDTSRLRVDEIKIRGIDLRKSTKTPRGYYNRAETKRLQGAKTHLLSNYS